MPPPSSPPLPPGNAPTDAAPQVAVARDDWRPAPSGTRRRLAGFVETLDVDASRAGDHADAIAQMRRGELQAIVVADVFDAATMSAVVDRLEQHDPPFVQTWFPAAFKAWFFGRNINLSDANLDGYFDEAQVFDHQLDALTAPAPTLRDRVGGLLSSLDGGRDYRAAPGPLPGQRYMFTTLRAHLEQGYIPAHYDNEMRLRPSYRHLAGIVDEHIISFVLVFGAADSGGALEVFDRRREPDEAELLSDDSVVAKPDLATLSSASFRLPAGSLIVLDSGRYLHRVTRVGGTRKRWTACSFIARQRGGETMFCWG